MNICVVIMNNTKYLDSHKKKGNYININVTYI